MYMRGKLLLNFYNLCKSNPYKISVPIIAATTMLAGHVGYKVGQQNVDVQTATEVILKHKATYTPEFFPTSKTFAKQYGRSGAYVSIYPTKNIGAAIYIVVDDTINGSKVLLTIQERIINKKSELVAEPPIGFFNDSLPSNSSVTASEMEFIERKTTKLFQQNGDRKLVQEARSAIVLEARELTKAGVLSKEYQVDNNLQDTAYREALEEAGIDLKQLKKQNSGIQITEQILGSAEKPGVHREDRLIIIKGNLPSLKEPTNPDEVKLRKWVYLKDISNDLTINVTIDGNAHRIRVKPYDGVPENINFIKKYCSTHSVTCKPRVF